MRKEKKKIDYFIYSVAADIDPRTESDPHETVTLHPGGEKNPDGDPSSPEAGMVNARTP